MLLIYSVLPYSSHPVPSTWLRFLDTYPDLHILLRFLLSHSPHPRCHLPTNVARRLNVLGSITHSLLACRDFFPVILTFLRQLPVIGHVLTLPYIRDVSVRSPLVTLSPFLCRPLSWLPS